MEQQDAPVVAQARKPRFHPVAVVFYLRIKKVSLDVWCQESLGLLRSRWTCLWVATALRASVGWRGFFFVPVKLHVWAIRSPLVRLVRHIGWLRLVSSL